MVYLNNDMLQKLIKLQIPNMKLWKKKTNIKFMKTNETLLFQSFSSWRAHTYPKNQYHTNLESF